MKVLRRGGRILRRSVRHSRVRRLAEIQRSKRRKQSKTGEDQIVARLCCRAVQSGFRVCFVETVETVPVPRWTSNTPLKQGVNESWQDRQLLRYDVSGLGCGGSCRAMTLAEMLVAVGVGSVALMLAATVFTSSSISFTAVGNYIAMDQ